MGLVLNQLKNRVQGELGAWKKLASSVKGRALEIIERRDVELLKEEVGHAVGNLGTFVATRVFPLTTYNSLSKANIDALTGLHRRKHLMAAIEEGHLSEIARRVEYRGEAMELAFLDIDHFKWVNDAFGHAFGDEVLKAFSKKLKGLCRKDKRDMVIRFGGEEFLIVLAGVSKLSGRDAEGMTTHEYVSHEAAAAAVIDRFLRNLDLYVVAGAGDKEFDLVGEKDLTDRDLDLRKLGDGAGAIAEMADYPKYATTKMLKDFVKSGNALRLTFSAGVAAFDGSPESFEEAKDIADSALYVVKRDGRNGVAFFDEEFSVRYDSMLARLPKERFLDVVA